MGASSNDGYCASNYASYCQNRRFSKEILDNVHGTIYLEPLALKFVDTEQFQRLRDLKQLGLTNMVYPGAVHTRFEHSLGVYHLAGEVAYRLRAQQDPEFPIEDFDIKTVKLAGLLHDIGHGPFSHTFERQFLPLFLNGASWSHEDMSISMIDYIVDKHHIDIEPECLKKAKEMVVASTEHGSHNSPTGKQFLYDIVANGRNGVDVDKFDYLIRDSWACGVGCGFMFARLMESMRVLGDEICYRAKDYITVYKLFSTRAEMHRTIYTHAKVKGIELMAVDALTKANEAFGIADAVQNPGEFWKLDDTILKRIEVDERPELKEARDLVLRIRRRDLYQFCNEFAVPKENLDHFKDVTPQDIICSQRSSDVTLKEEDIAVSTVKIDLTRGSSNPLESVKFFQDYDSTDRFTIPVERISHLVPAVCQDKIVSVYAKKPELVEVVSQAFENFQMTTYGVKAILATPEKKKKNRKRLFPY
ncbi:unnamed protein product [Linum trigynum]|uniref:HD domain-containing protein n=1 Tax=Linum trigynum TaxID=586398 RepID=A0AAV2ECD9_9ROSI